MRFSFVLSEVLTGLRRNVTMTVAMILTTAISLGLLGGGLLVVRMIDHMRDNFGDEVEVNVYLNKDISGTDKGCTAQPCAGIKSALEQDANVELSTFENQDAAFDRFQRVFSGQPELLELTRKESLPAIFHLKLKNPDRANVIVQTYSNKPGIDRVEDQGVFLERFFGVLNGVRNATWVVAAIQAIAALLLISNTIQVSAFTRRTEVGIMRLVGATRWYTQLPFLLEAVVAGLVGAVLAVAGLIGIKGVFVDNVLAEPIAANIIPKIQLLDIFWPVAPILVAVAILISAVTGYVTLRLYVRT
ncbi:permease-like cell division protein FtsX [Kibdelosporangium phytohabitans]|uniref:Cell division protein FtsX n=1 Tax=Kibdelosporangium phytohabitans TaxID=860235 RepID=A0A0N9HQE0_9PSEU|nr:permease-like cell division protein FtsX [Kibdelosporangium phytohabitans]ALG06901.1 cell division protein FtsX [Kibdelosporangium phytohabitans]MBE1468160.1 cell division transport system permease protein [Kibdelosporangium phytohabitans]